MTVVKNFQTSYNIMYTRELAYLHYMNYGYHSALLKREIFYSVLEVDKVHKNDYKDNSFATISFKP